MDWRARRYYVATFSPEAKNMRIQILKLIGKGVTIHFNSGIPKQPDEVEERGRYMCIIGCKYGQSEMVEYELRKAERRDCYCFWKEIKRDTSKKYFDVLGREMPYRKCDIYPNKRCNRCMSC
jgi:hypothetical protein